MSDPISIDEARKDKVRRDLQRESVDAPSIKMIAPVNPRHRGLLAGGWGEFADPYGLPPDCPVRPLGRDGDVCYVLNTFGCVSTLTAANAKRGQVQMIFADAINYVIWAWPRKVAKDKPIDNFDSDGVCAALVNACTIKSKREGAWNMVDRIRGRGAWRDDQGRLVLHCGDRVLSFPGRREPAVCLHPDEIDGYLYPVRAAMGGPAEAWSAPGPGSPGEIALELLRSWNWARPELDPYLMLGWLGAAMVGGALVHRPAVYLTGDKGVGKSTLKTSLASMLGGGCITTEDTTAAGIYRLLQNDAIPVLIDENEAKADDRKAIAVLELARAAYSGGVTLRAAPDQGAAQFVARSSFLFASINPPSLEPQDRSRMAILELRPLDRRLAYSPMAEADKAAIGRQILARIVYDFGRVERLINLFRARLVEAGHDGRGGDTFGTLAAMAHAILHDEDPDPALLDDWAAKLDPSQLVELEHSAEGWADCLSHLLGAQPDSLRTHACKSVGQIVSRYADGKMTYSGGDDFRTADDHARDALALVGCALVQPKAGADGHRTAELFIPANHPALQKVFAGTKWAGRGVWCSSLRQAPTHMWRNAKARIDARVHSGVAFSILKLTQEEE